MTQKVYVVGLGPGGIEQMTQRAKAALESCDVIAGYHVLQARNFLLLVCVKR